MTGAIPCFASLGKHEIKDNSYFTFSDAWSWLWKSQTFLYSSLLSTIVVDLTKLQLHCQGSMIAISLGCEHFFIKYYATYFNSAKVCGEGKSEEWLYGWEAYPKNNSTKKNAARDILKTVSPWRTTTTVIIYCDLDTKVQSH